MDEYGYMDDDTKDYFVNEVTTDEEFGLALERYLYLMTSMPICRATNSSKTVSANLITAVRP
jgi:hypothetical protein